MKKKEPGKRIDGERGVMHERHQDFAHLGGKKPVAVSLANTSPSLASPMKISLSFLILCFVLANALPGSAKEMTLLERFEHPPAEARSTGYWAWLDGNVSAPGITADLEEMKRLGMGGAVQMFLEQQIAPGSVVFDTPQYWELVAHAIREGARLGLEIGFHNGPGWTGSGGPWVKPEDAMKRFTWTETHVRGGSHLQLTLPQPSPERPFYRDIAVLAVPESQADADLIVSYQPKLFSGDKELDGAALLDGDWRTSVTFTKGEALLEFDEPVTASALALAAPRQVPMAITAEVEVSADGAEFQAVGSVPILAENGVALIRSGGGNFAPATGRFWKITLRATKGEPVNFPVGWLSLRGRPVAADFDVHAAFRESKKTPATAASCPISAKTSYPALSEVMDLTRHMQPDGR